MSRPMDHLAEQIRLYQHGQLSRRQLLQRGAALGLSATGLTALGAINPVAGQERFVHPAIRAVAQGDETLRATLATAQKTGDLGPTDSIVRGLERGAKDFNYETKIVEVVQGEYTETLRSLASSGAELIIAAYPPMIDAVVEIAPQYPDQKFALIVGSTPDVIPNVMSFWERASDASYLVGALAGLYTKSGIVGCTFPTRNPEMDRFISGYQQGVKATNKDAKFLLNIVGGEKPFEDPATAKRLALVHQEQGADVVFAAGGSTCLGVLEAAADSNGGFVATGADPDQCLLHPASTLATVRIYWDNMAYRAMQMNREGTWTAGNFLNGINEGGDDICTFDDSDPEGHLDPKTGHEIGPKLPQEVRDMIWSLRDKVMAGEITIVEKVEE
jgi:basic membrane protein A and related proteins